MRYAALGVLAITLAIAYGIWYAYSVILVALLNEFGWSRSVLAGAFSVFTLVHGGANPVIGMLCARFRPLRVMAVGGAIMGLALFADSFISSPLGLYAGFGVLTALGVALAGWVPALVFVQREFPERLGLSIGIVSAGIGVGMVVLVPLTQLLIDAFGWRAAFRVLGLVAVLWIVPSTLWLRWAILRERESQNRGQTPEKQNQEKSGSVPKTEPELALGEALRTQAFWLFAAAFFFGNISSQTLHVHQVAYLVDQGQSAIIAATVVGVVGFASIFGKVGGGWLSDRFERELVYMGGIAIMVASAFVLLSLAGNPSQWGAYGYAVLLGVGYAATASLIPAMMSDRFTGPHFGTIVGVALVASSMGSALGPWQAGTLYDATGSYTIAFLIAAGCGVVAGAAGWRVRALKIRGQGRNSNSGSGPEFVPTTSEQNSSPDPRPSAGLDQKVDAQGGQDDKIQPQMEAAPVPAPDPETTVNGEPSFGDLGGGRRVLSPEELAANLTEMIRGYEGCENVTVLEVYRTDVDRRDGCNWSLAILLDPADVAPEVYSLAYGSVIGTARATWNLDNEIRVAVLDLDLG